MTDKNKKTDLEIDLARTAWKQHLDASHASWGHTINFALLALRLPSTVNGATAAALLAFFSANHDKLKDQMDLIGWSLFAFIIGMIAPAIATGAAYVSQEFFTKFSEDYTFSFEHPYVIPPKNNPKEKKGIFFQRVAFSLGVLSIICFLYGAYNFFSVVKSLK